MSGIESLWGAMVNIDKDNLRRRFRLSTHALKLDVEEAEERLNERIPELADRVERLERQLGRRG